MNFLVSSWCCGFGRKITLFFRKNTETLGRGLHRDPERGGQRLREVAETQREGDRDIETEEQGARERGGDRTASGWWWDQKEDSGDPELLAIRTEIKGVTVRSTQGRSGLCDYKSARY